jgi:hypothetical protein
LMVYQCYLGIGSGLIVIRFPSTHNDATCSKKAGRGLTDPRRFLKMVYQCLMMIWRK